ncbi:MAG: DUF523 domain-containing protein [Deltaproteobacteria bacterium]|nr:MAG: DUF523 domain-containing protein [Deltaproteobacteria bacterium]
MTGEKTYKYIVSACLAGEKCRYDCQAKPRQYVIDLVQNGEALAVCPEQLGGLPTPRPPAEEVSPMIFKTIDGDNVTKEYLKGASEASLLAKNSGVTKALLKSKSPMCGSGSVYDGTFKGKLVKGDGIFTRMLKELGIEVEEIE